MRYVYSYAAKTMCVITWSYLVMRGSLKKFIQKEESYGIL